MWYVVSQKHLSLSMTFLLLIFIYVQKCILLDKVYETNKKPFFGMNRYIGTFAIDKVSNVPKTFLHKYSLISTYVYFLHYICLHIPYMHM